jgi:hypothetical protein
MQGFPEQKYGQDALKILNTSLNLIDNRQPEFYRVAALQLRLLLCDTTRRHAQMVDISLAKRLWPDLRLHPLNALGHFDANLPPLLLDDWLMQVLPGDASRSITLRQLIRRVCDQDGGAHVDLKPRAGLHRIADVSAWIYKIAAEVISALEKATGGR